MGLLDLWTYEKQAVEGRGIFSRLFVLVWFGIFSRLVGMFANVDFINNPTLKDYEVTKSILAHATLLFNVLLLCVFGHIKVDLIKNMVHSLTRVELARF